MTTYNIAQNDKVRISTRPELGVGEVLRVSETAGFYQADVVFEGPDGRRLEVVPVDLLEKADDLWARLERGSADKTEDYILKQTAWDLAYANSGGEPLKPRETPPASDIAVTRLDSKRRAAGARCR